MGSLSIITQAGIEALRARSLRLNRLLIDLFDTRLAQRGMTLITPREDQRRGGHVSLGSSPGRGHSAVDCTRPK